MLTVLLFALCGCGKDPLNELPPATQTGANTFGCKVNGVTYKCSGHWDFKNFLTLEGVCGNYANGEFAIYALIYDPHYKITFKFNCIKNTIGVYREDIRLGSGGELVDGFDSKIIVTRFDDSVISGTFQMKFQFDGNENRSYEYTEGRFDIKLKN